MLARAEVSAVAKYIAVRRSAVVVVGSHLVVLRLGDWDGDLGAVIGGGDGEGGGERPSALGSGVSRWRGGQMRRSGFPAVGWVWLDHGALGLLGVCQVWGVCGAE